MPSRIGEEGEVTPFRKWWNAGVAPEPWIGTRRRTANQFARPPSQPMPRFLEIDHCPVIVIALEMNRSYQLLRLLRIQRSRKRFEDTLSSMTIPRKKKERGKKRNLKI